MPCKNICSSSSSTTMVVADNAKPKERCCTKTTASKVAVAVGAALVLAGLFMLMMTQSQLPTLYPSCAKIAQDIAQASHVIGLASLSLSLIITSIGTITALIGLTVLCRRPTSSTSSTSSTSPASSASSTSSNAPATSSSVPPSSQLTSSPNTPDPSKPTPIPTNSVPTPPASPSSSRASSPTPQPPTTTDTATLSPTSTPPHSSSTTTSTSSLAISSLPLSRPPSPIEGEHEGDGVDNLRNPTNRRRQGQHFGNAHPSPPATPYSRNISAPSLVARGGGRSVLPTRTTRTEQLRAAAQRGTPTNPRSKPLPRTPTSGASGSMAVNRTRPPARTPGARIPTTAPKKAENPKVTAVKRTPLSSTPARGAPSTRGSRGQSSIRIR